MKVIPDPDFSLISDSLAELQSVMDRTTVKCFNCGFHNEYFMMVREQDAKLMTETIDHIRDFFYNHPDLQEVFKNDFIEMITRLIDSIEKDKK